jgi:hypothetical protein
MNPNKGELLITILETDPNDEVDFDDDKVFSMDSNIVLTDSDADDHKVFRDYEEYCEEEISIEKVCILISMLLSLFFVFT